MNDNKKSGKDKTATTIKNYMTDIRNAELITAKEKTKLRCKCPHVAENGKAMLFRSDNKKSDITGNPLFVCRLCGAYLDIGELDEDDLNTAIDRICRASDIIKMRLRPATSDDDANNYKAIWKIEYMLRSGKFSDLFKAARRRNNKKRNNNGNNGGFIAGRPMSR